MNFEKYLPIGTVVMLKGGKKRCMITGFCIATKNMGTFDYCGILYPEGIISMDNLLTFNHNQIEKIYHLGLRDQESESFNEKLKNMMNK